MKTLTLIAVLLLTAYCSLLTAQTTGDYARYVNPFIGTGGHGHTFPGAVLPFGMAFWQWRVNPEYFALLTHGIGLVALVVAGIFLLFGSIWVRKIVNSISL